MRELGEDVEIQCLRLMLWRAIGHIKGDVENIMKETGLKREEVEQLIVRYKPAVNKLKVRLREVRKIDRQTQFETATEMLKEGKSIQTIMLVTTLNEEHIEQLTASLKWVNDQKQTTDN
jgi:predicted transposase YdaD